VCHLGALWTVVSRCPRTHGGRDLGPATVGAHRRLFHGRPRTGRGWQRVSPGSDAEGGGFRLAARLRQRELPRLAGHRDAAPGPAPAAGMRRTFRAPRSYPARGGGRRPRPQAGRLLPGPPPGAPMLSQRLMHGTGRADRRLGVKLTGDPWARRARRSPSLVMSTSVEPWRWRRFRDAAVGLAGEEDAACRLWAMANSVRTGHGPDRHVCPRVAIRSGHE
jgi:hypothetical protein